MLPDIGEVGSTPGGAAGGTVAGAARGSDEVHAQAGVDDVDEKNGDAGVDDEKTKVDAVLEECGNGESPAKKGEEVQGGSMCRRHPPEAEDVRAWILHR